MAQLLINSLAVYGILGVMLDGSIIKLVLGFGQLIKVARIFKALEIGSAIASAAKAAFSSPLSMATAGLAGLGILGVLVGGIMTAVNSAQSVEDGIAPSSEGPFTVTNRFGATAITATGDGVAVGPNINRSSPSPSLDLSPITNVITVLSSRMETLMNKQQTIPQFSLQVDGKAIGTAVGKQIETGTAQSQYTSYKVA